MSNVIKFHSGNLEDWQSDSKHDTRQTSLILLLFVMLIYYFVSTDTEACNLEALITEGPTATKKIQFKTRNRARTTVFGSIEEIHPHITGKFPVVIPPFLFCLHRFFFCLQPFFYLQCVSCGPP